MKLKYLILFLFFLIPFYNFSQNIKQEKIESAQSLWDQGVPVCPDDEYINMLMDKINIHKIRDNQNSGLTEEEISICLELGLAFYSRKEFDAANWWFNKSVNSIVRPISSEVSASKEYVYLIKEVMVPVPDQKNQLDEKDQDLVKKDQNFVNGLPQSYDKLTKEDLKEIAKQIDAKIKKLIEEKDSLQKINANKLLIDSKTGTIKTLSKEKEIVNLNIVKNDLEGENQELEVQKSKLRKYLFWSIIGLTILLLAVLALLQRKTIKIQDNEIEKQLIDLSKKNTYLEHAARIIRHDMHSGINTYIPRGISSLEKRITEEEARNLKIEAPIKMIKEGLNHTQKVYKSVYEFTNLVKQNSVLDKKEYDLKDLINEYLKNTSYSSQVLVEDLIKLEVNGVLFCNAVDNLIKNGLKYNENSNKLVKIYMEGNDLIVQDNGKGLTQKEFEKICYSYVKKKNKDLDEESKGLGLNISLTILKEHGFDLTCEKIEIGTKMKIKIKND